MDEQSGESEEEEVMGEEQVSGKWKNWYQNEVDEERKGAYSKDKVKNNDRSDQLFLDMMMTVTEQE